MVFADIVERVRQLLPEDLPVYLVGGAVRDALRGRPAHDLDFVLEKGVLDLARRTANALRRDGDWDVAYYPLDVERETARVILIPRSGERTILDFATFRGPDLLSDLRARDFTINAMAVSVQQLQSLIDPLGGAADLKEKRLRACSDTAFEDDPLRIIRGVRIAANLGFLIVPETRGLMRRAVPGLERVSPERRRDELFRILEGPQPAAGIRALEALGALEYVLPELVHLKNVTQSPPHIQDVWNHTLGVVQNLGSILRVLAPQYDPDQAASLMLGLISLRLGRYRQLLAEHLEASFTPERKASTLLILAGLYHDAGKPATRSVEAGPEGERIRFLGHEQVGAEMIAARAAALRLSNEEAQRLQTIVLHHMRPLLLAQSGEMPSKRATYRFFRDTGEAGVDICLLSLADVLATYGPALPPQVWGHHLDVVRALFEAWWERREDDVLPPPLIDGNDLLGHFKLQPGPLIGKLLEAIREAQAAGEVRDRQQALHFAREWLAGDSGEHREQA